MSAKLLIEHHLEFLSLKGSCTGSSESTLVKIQHCWKSHVTTHYFSLYSPNTILQESENGHCIFLAKSNIIQLKQSCSLYTLITPLIDFPMFYIKYLTVYNVQMHVGAIRQLLYGCAYIHTHKPYNNLHMYHPNKQFYLLSPSQIRNYYNVTMHDMSCNSFFFVINL